jgi:hypothetical protein
MKVRHTDPGPAARKQPQLPDSGCAMGERLAKIREEYEGLLCG